MANLNVENLNRIVSTGDTEALLGGGGATAGEFRVRKEMEAQGLKPFEAEAVGGAEKAGGASFADILTRSVDSVNQMQFQADQAVHELVAGRSKNIHETMLTIERADASLKLMMSVRNKILDAYREIMRMQV
ncbi:MAG: flagellar hook-basal body complex protein FliE [Oligoflexia bacterium]|nr:flagellar hook-basal body complex protein FliE [Oligoflexia bacterium]